MPSPEVRTKGADQTPQTPKLPNPAPDLLNEERDNTGSTCEPDGGLSCDEDTFVVEVLPEANGVSLGITVGLDEDPSYLTIDGVRPSGLVAQWNTFHDESVQVRVGQVIKSVNGVSGRGRDMLTAIRNLEKDVALRLLIHAGREKTSALGLPAPSIGAASAASWGPFHADEAPPTAPRCPFIVQLRPGGGDASLGLAVSLDDDPSYVTIDGIAPEGLISDWNGAQSADLQVCAGDAIMSVNGCAGNGRQMLEMLTSLKDLNNGVVVQLKIDPMRRKMQQRRPSEKRTTDPAPGEEQARRQWRVR